MLTIENLEKMGFRNLKRTGDDIMMSCPLGIHDDHKPSFGINIEDGRWNCFSCNYSGNSIKSLAKILNKPELLKYFEYTSSSDLLNKIKSRLQPQVEFDEPEDYLVDYYKFNYRHDYLEDRGINEETVKKFDIGYDPIQKAIVFPIYTDKNELLGFTYRFTESKNMRYYHEVEKGQTVFGANLLQKGTVIIVEGHIDVLKAYSLGYKNVVGLMGTKMSLKQRKMINKYATSIILALDNDYDRVKNWGKLATLKIGKSLLEYSDLKVLQYPKNKKDFGDLSTKDTLNILSYIDWRKECITPKL